MATVATATGNRQRVLNDLHQLRKAALLLPEYAEVLSVEFDRKSNMGDHPLPPVLRISAESFQRMFSGQVVNIWMSGVVWMPFHDCELEASMVETFGKSTKVRNTN